MNTMQPIGHIPSFGKSGDVEIAGKIYHYASRAELRFLQEIEICLRGEAIQEFVWQPPAFPLTYKHGGSEWTQGYRADAMITWSDSDEWVIEVKRGYMAQKACTKVKRFCQQYPDKKLVLVWIGSLPKAPKPGKKGQAYRKLEMLEPLVDHIWQIKTK